MHPSRSRRVALRLSALTPALAKTVNIAIDQASPREVVRWRRRSSIPDVQATCRKYWARPPTRPRAVFNADVYGLVKDRANDDVLNSGRGEHNKLGQGERLRAADHRRGSSAAIEAKNFRARVARAAKMLNLYDDYTDFDEFEPAVSDDERAGPQAIETLKRLDV